MEFNKQYRLYGGGAEVLIKYRIKKRKKLRMKFEKLEEKFNDINAYFYVFIFDGKRNPVYDRIIQFKKKVQNFIKEIEPHCKGKSKDRDLFLKWKTEAEVWFVELQQIIAC
ncbi:hypothetical protein P5G65_25275 [Paenibacillus chondroitinus]|uniref:Uncharacterized protein n=1 Tax=Paenibacillus chondroitinus TaxID=59842 RepID=A0ABU6DK81_9BACL|nr:MULTISPECIES: hypothetical protein [Paenibacillus]MCY9658510.1 hypothetical protein [Paenibacillus anseongense]MEB4797222.1 hypothetical protein [Paenibacillus chondroitinus]